MQVASSYASAHGIKLGKNSIDMNVKSDTIPNKRTDKPKRKAMAFPIPPKNLLMSSPILLKNRCIGDIFIS